MIGRDILLVRLKVKHVPMALPFLLQESLNLFNLDVSMCLVPDAWQANINTPELGHLPAGRPGLQEGEEGKQEIKNQAQGVIVCHCLTRRI